MNQFLSTHNLDFECAEWPICPEWTQYRIGTCHGLWFLYGIWKIIYYSYIKE